MTKYVKVMFGTTSGANKEFEYEIGEVNVANNWNPTATSGKEFGGFNFATEDKILRWLHRGDTIYNVEVPIDAEIVEIEGATTIYRANKIIISNPRTVTDEIALEFYEKSDIPEIAYYKALGSVAIMNYKETALAIFKDKVNQNNIDIVLEEWKNFIDRPDRKDCNETVKMIDELLLEVKSDLLISINVDKEPFIKKITNDKIINLTGESGSGKSYFSNRWKDNEDYIIIDTDIVFSDKESDNRESVELRKIFKGQSKDILIADFDYCYKEILNYYKDSDKTIVIDSAQYRNIKDVSILKGQLIVMRTSINECYKRCINRYKNKFSYATTEDLEKFKQKKLGMYSWYKGLNRFIEKVEKLKKENTNG